MPLGILFELCAGSRAVAAACGLIAAGMLAAPAAAQNIACTAPQQGMQQVELMFGRNIGRRLGVSNATWSRFLAREVTPRFPEGLSVIDAAGQWQDREHGRVVREPSKLVMIVTADDLASRDKIAAIVAAYKDRFRQQSVGVVTRPVCAAF
jgi:Protein of unknown function (DUF3574)